METAKVKEQLKEIGLTENEVKVHIACLQLGSSLASKIAEKSKIYRTIIYDLLNSLIEKGLVAYIIKENRKYFHALPPDAAITKYLEEKERKLQEQKEKIQPLLTQLKNLEQPKKEPYSIDILSGKEGFKTILEDVLKEGKDYKLIGYESLGPHLVKYYYAHWNKRRVKKKIKRYIIAKKKAKPQIEKYKKLTEAKFLPKNYEVPTSVLIYNNKAVLFLPLEEDFVAIKIDSKKIVKSFLTYFNILWKIAKP